MDFPVEDKILNVPSTSRGNLRSERKDNDDITHYVALDPFGQCAFYDVHDFSIILYCGGSFW